MHSIELKFGMHITGHRQTDLIDFGECRIYSSFYRSEKKKSYTLRLIESNTLKGSSVQTMHSIELKFGTYIIGHHRTNPVDFDECRMHRLI